MAPLSFRLNFSNLNCN